MATFSFAAHNRFVTPSSICESRAGFDFPIEGSIQALICVIVMRYCFISCWWLKEWWLWFGTVSTDYCFRNVT